uniref:Uncharacterized protein n=1 Tax=Hyaloperonospora arabidopsidis (strain Emoy2) TaxID=559515 RepID=M4BA51_HYAAE
MGLLPARLKGAVSESGLRYVHIAVTTEVSDHDTSLLAREESDFELSSTAFYLEGQVVKLPLCLQCNTAVSPGSR